MSINEEIVRARIKEAIGRDTQPQVADKIHTTQGTISKILSGEQSITLDKACAIAETYNVSLDWLIGFSDCKRVRRKENDDSYASIAKSLLALKKCRHEFIEDKRDDLIHIKIYDPLLKELLLKGDAMQRAGEDYLDMWLDTALASYENKPLIWRYTWSDMDVDYLASNASNDKEWLQVYYAAKECEEEAAEFYSEPSPFK